MTEASFESKELVRVKLTDAGRETFVAKSNKYATENGIDMAPPMLREDSNGWSVWSYSSLKTFVGGTETMTQETPLYTHIEALDLSPVLEEPTNKRGGKMLSLVIAAVVLAAAGVYLGSAIN